VTSGAGAYAAVAIATAVVLLVLVVMRAAKPLLSHWSAPVTVIEVEYRRGHGTLGPFIRDLNEVAGRLEDLEISDPETEAELRRVSLRVTTPELAAVDKAVDRLRSRDEVLDVRVERPHAGHPD
jgi:uncharacterized membrane protein YhiD involved in acid resistance